MSKDRADVRTRRTGTRMLGGLLVAGMVLAGRAHALSSGFIDVRLPNNIGYELAPIQIDLGVHQVDRPELTLAYRICDLERNVLAGDDIAVRPENGEARRTISFTPPRWGYYAVLLSVLDGGEPISGFARHIGVTPRYPGLHALAAGERRGWWNVAPLQSFAGLLLDRTGSEPPEQTARALAEAASCGVTMLVQINNTDPEHVRAAVSQLKGKARYWEVVNEPNARGLSPERYVGILKELYPLVKGIAPEAVVMGPAVRGIDLDWLAGFYAAGGGRLTDALSFHDMEGGEGIDYFHLRWKLGRLRELMGENGDADKPIWQTSRSICAVRSGCFMGAVQAVRMTLERDIMETFGVANDRNIHYYANVTGYNEVPAFVMSDSGPHPAALACRTRAAMTMGRRFARKLDFGPTGNRIFLGLEYRGEDGSTVMLRNLGTLDQNLDLRARGGRSLEVVDAFGNATKVPVRVRKARLTVSRMPLYIRLSRNQRISVPRLDMGRNVAGEASFSYSGGTGSDLGLLADGLFQNPHLGSPWGPMWKGAYAGRTFDEKPETLEIVFPAPRTVAGVLVFGARADDGHCALLDYDLQFRDGGGWATLDEVRSPCPPSDRVRVYHSNDGGDAMHPGFYTTACAWFMDDSFFVHRLARPVKTDGLRLVIRRITRGFAPDEAAERAAVVGAPAGQPLQAQSLELREIEVYGGR